MSHLTPTLTSSGRAHLGEQVPLSMWVFSSVFLVYLVLSSRLFVVVETGGRGVVPVMPPLLVVGMFVVGAAHFKLLSESVASGMGRLGWPLFLLASAVLPLLGVGLLGHPSRFLFDSLNYLCGISSFFLGYGLGKWGPLGLRGFSRLFLLAVVFEATYAGQQWFSFRYGSILEPLTWLRDWDMASQVAYSDAYVLVSRSVGTFVNPNSLGLFGVMTAPFFLCLTGGKTRWLGMLSSLMMVVLSESRGSMMALASLMLAWFCLRIMFGVGSRVGGGTLWGLSAIFVAVLALWTTDLSDIFMENERLLSGVGILSAGTQSDINLQSRIDVWSLLLGLYWDHPMGTWITPDTVYGTFIDNQYIRVLLQGGPVFLVVFVVLVLRGLRLLWAKDKVSLALALSYFAFAINSFTCDSMATSGFAVLMLMEGLVLAWGQMVQVEGGESEGARVS